MTDPPVHVEVASPQRYDRGQLAARVVFAIVLGWLGISAGWVSWLLSPGGSADRGDRNQHAQPREYPARLGPPLWRGLAWLLQLSAYMMFLTDRFPLGAPAVSFEVDISARPTVGSSLLRLVTSIPSAIVLCFLSLISGVMWLISAIGVLVVAHVPDSILGYQRGVLRWQARLVAYHASLVNDYPPFMLDTHGHLPPARGIEQPA